MGGRAETGVVEGTPRHERGAGRAQDGATGVEACEGEARNQFFCGRFDTAAFAPMSIPSASAVKVSRGSRAFGERRALCSPLASVE